jgi:hypothetical protein
VKNKDLQIFSLLKQKIVERMRQSYPGINPSITEWKGQEIVDFQEELLRHANAHISEKWFYNHIKSENKALPRIDMLNLLSRYAGYANWDDFRFKHTGNVAAATLSGNPNRYFIFVPALVLLLVGIMLVFFRVISTREYTFRFYDADTKEPITNSIIEVQVLKDNESPVSHLCLPDGSFAMKTKDLHVRFVVRSPYYQPDTISRILNKFNRIETVSLQRDNYALMIHYFSTMNVRDWQKRRDQLNQMIADTAMIYEVFEKGAVGVELYNKWEFINKLTLPATGLKHIEILDTRYQGEQISLIRFRQKEAGL